MTWAIPNWWTFLLLALAAWRTWRLLAHDVILDPARRKIVWGERSREFVHCVFCFGAWISVGWWLAWVAWPHWTTVVAVPFAISAALAVVEVKLGPDE